MKSKTPQVVEIHNPRSFGQRYGQQLSRDTLEQFREKNRKGKLKQPAQVDDLALLSTSATVSAPTTIPATISAIQKEKIKVCYYAESAVRWPHNNHQLTIRRSILKITLRPIPTGSMSDLILIRGLPEQRQK